jgi:8-oxo-dGTP diphosphatase
MKSSVACIIFEDESVCETTRVFIAKRLPSGQMGNRWEFPGGKVEKNESLEQAIVREFLEEFGVAVRVEKKIAQAVFYHNNEPSELHAFRVFFNQPALNFVLTEHSQTDWVHLQEVKNRSFVDSDLLLYDAIASYMKT